MILALLLARQGIDVTVLEAARNFDRSFRGDTLHPAILELMADLGLADDLLALPHTRARGARFISPQSTQVVADFTTLNTRYPYLAVMKQARFLEFLHERLRAFSHVRVRFGARVEGLTTRDGRVTGVTARTDDGIIDVPATLTVGADGRFSKVRDLASLPLHVHSPGQDVLWFALPRRASDPSGFVDLYLGGPHCIVTTDHGERWQVGYSIEKGSYARAKAAGVTALRRAVEETIPWLADRASLLTDWRQVQLLSVQVARAPRWHRDGLLLIGDAAHPISPIGGLGINMAVQDAIAAANRLSAPLRAGALRERHLRSVQRARAWQIAVLQAQQVVEEREVITIHGGATLHVPMLALRMLHRLPGLRRVPAYITAYGLRPERLRR